MLKQNTFLHNTYALYGYRKDNKPSKSKAEH